VAIDTDDDIIFLNWSIPYTFTNLPYYTESSNLTNGTTAGDYIKHSLEWNDENDLDGYIFSFCNGTWGGTTCDNWVNDSWVAMTGTLNSSNVSKFVNNTIGSRIAWQVHANNSIDNWDSSIIYSYTTTYKTKDGLVSTVTGDTPFYTNSTNPINVTLNEGESQLVTWWVNATGTVGSSHIFYAYANISDNETINNRTDEVNLTIDTATAADTCTYGGSGHWEINMEDLCNTTTAYNISTHVNFTGTSGYWNCSAIINMTEMKTIPDTTTVWLNSNCYLIVRG